MKVKSPAAPLKSEQVALVRALEKSNMTPSNALVKTGICGVHETLSWLVEQGYVQEHPGRQSNGASSMLHSLSSKGQAALRKAGAALATESPVPSLAMPRAARDTSGSVYMGEELRPFTGRAGSMDAMKHPSRFGENLRHADGSITPLV
ncbi:hypothetical protein [Variovorax saccharolyticus]|uniref:hypothetical protein n=1 Tax=Variovorax saccharolyticus TaxID=3053516 RepID=UPI002575F1F4|nr:hypothetical protein [Variovorax sp. J31P216]MDM0029824.1 hypothetical protein [Variovorax sp. J31P216]